MPSARALKDAMDLGLRDCKVYVIKGWHPTATGFSEKELRAIGRALDAGSPVTATFIWPTGVPADELIDARRLLVDRNTEPKKDSHAVILVGYGLDPTVPGGGYIIIRNQWNASWCVRGHAAISFAYAHKHGICAYVLAPP